MHLKINKICDDACEKLLAAINAPADGQSILHVLTPLSNFAKKWSATTARAGAWAGKLIEITTLFAEDAKNSGSHNGYFGTPPSNVWKSYQNIFEIFSCDVPLWERSALDELILLCVCISAGNGFSLSEGVTAGLLSCVRSINSKRLIGWRSIAQNPPLTLNDIDEQISKNHFGESQMQFLLQLQELLQHQISVHPSELMRGWQAVEEKGEEAQLEKASPKPTLELDRELVLAEQSLDAFERSPLSIASKIAASNYANWSAKVGVDQRWDQIPLADLKLICAAIVTHLSADDPAIRQHATLALVCLLFGLNEVAALELPVGAPLLGTDSDQWFDPETGSHVWNQAALLNPENGRTNRELLNYIPLPRCLVESVQRYSGPHVAGRRIKDILFVQNPFDPTSFGHYLKTVSGEAHPATAARLSQSFGNAFHQLTGSDVGAAFCSLRLCLASPAAIYYFSPTRSWVHLHCSKVFEGLGLGEAVPFGAPDTRMGSRRLPLDFASIKKGWSLLEATFVSTYRAVLKWSSRDAAIASFNNLSVMAATAMVAGNAGRASRPDRMQISHLYGNNSMFPLGDKDVKDSGLWRLLPQTKFSLALLKLYQHARSYVAGRIGCVDIAESGPSAAFISIESATLLVQPLKTESIATCVKEFFDGREVNFFRHLHITNWVESGRDRWLLRCLTGHGRTGVLPFDASMAVAPKDAMEVLAKELNDQINSMLGAWSKVQKIADQLAATKVNQFTSPRYEWLYVSARGAKLNHDGWLEKISPRVIADWELVNRIRNRISLADFDDDHVAHVVSTIAIDGLPLELAFTNDRADKFVSLGQAEGELWARDHDVHPAFMAHLPPTRLIGSQATKGVTHERLLRDTAKWLRRTDRTHGWPIDDRLCVERFESACVSWRRIELPPALALSASPSFESCAASLHSLTRLAGGEESVSRLSSVGFDLPVLRKSAQLKTHNLSALTTLINKVSDDKEDKGQDLARANELVKELDRLPSGTFVFEWAKQYLCWELNAVIRGAQYQNAISSLATRWTALRPALDKLDLLTASDDVGEDLILETSSEVVRFCTEQEDQDGSKSGAGKKRARDALQRLYKWLYSVGISVPIDCWALIGGPHVSAKRRSAGSTLIFESDVQGLVEEISRTFSDRKFEQQFLLTKTSILADVPSRSGEVGAIFRGCLTDGGAICFRPNAFGADKTKHATRLVYVSEATREQIERFALLGRSIRHEGKYMFRFDDHAKAMDVAANEFMEDRLKRITKDEYCRLHSLRARAYCDRAWPGWERITRAFLRGELTPAEAYSWTQSVSFGERWTILANAAVAAGHGAVEVGLNSYASIWSLIYSIHMYATLHSCRAVTPFWRERAGVKAEAMRKALYRAKSTRSDNGWLYLVNQLGLSQAKPALGPVELQASDLRTEPNKAEAISATKRLQYVVLQMLSMDSEQARHELRLPAEIEGWAVQVIPSPAEVARARKRKRTEPGSVSLDSETKLLLSDSGAALTHWITRLTHSQCAWLQALLMRWDQRIPGELEAIWDADFWRLIATDMPSDITLKVSFGQGAHLPIESESNLRQSIDGFTLGDRIDGIGKMPEVAVRFKEKDSRSDQARLTSLVKLALIARIAIERKNINSLKVNRD